MKKPTAVAQLVRVPVMEVIDAIRERFASGAWTSEDVKWLIEQATGKFEMLEAIEEWHENWDDHYDGDQPLKDYEAKMLKILENEERKGISSKREVKKTQ